MSVLWPLHVALTARLRGDAALMGLLPGGVHSGSVPSTAARPYLVLNSPTEEEADTFAEYGQSATIQLDTYSPSNVKSTQVVDQVLDRVEMLLRTPLELDGHLPATPRKELRAVLVEDDETRHGTVRYGIFTFEAP